MTSTPPTITSVSTIGKILIMALVCGALLSLTHSLSRDQISENQQAFETQQLLEVVGNPNIRLVEQAGEYQLIQNGQDIGHLRSVVTNEGYNGEIRFWLATTHSGEVLGVRVIRHQETPGLGDKLELVVSDWILDFNATSLDNRSWDVKKFGGDFDQFSGATITPRAVVLAIKAELEAQPSAQSPTQPPTEPQGAES